MDRISSVMANRLQIALPIIIIVLMMGQPTIAVAEGVSQQASIDSQVDSLLAQMGPEDKVGQLFVVTYHGPYSAESEIAQLVTTYRVGGVMLSLRNDNFDAQSPLPQQIGTVSAELQKLAADRHQLPPPEAGAGPIGPGPYIPLFIGLVDDRSNVPTYNNLPDFSYIPSHMALGATWDPHNSELAGQILGSELETVGVNLILAPSADVVELPQPSSPGDLGTWVFGGEPYWVSRNVSSYVSGLNTGSGGRVLVIVPHFPGHGGADRLASLEVPTVRRSLEQLSQFDLVPFFAVASGQPDTNSIAGGLMTDHIKYLGFQGDNIRVATRPISLDPQALSALMRLEPLADWRSGGGLLMTDALGAQGIRRYYGADNQPFPNRRIAQDALLAGNDLLYLADFGADPTANQSETIIDTIGFFIQAYKDDPAFRTRVDDAVRRILRKKLELYSTFDYQKTVIPTARAEIGANSEVAFSVAQNALTLLSPLKADQLGSPQAGERIVVFTDTRTERLCSTCPDTPIIKVDALQSAITRLTGPQASALGLGPIQSFSFDELVSYLDTGPFVNSGSGETPVPNPVDQALRSANWVVFLMQNITTDVPSSDAVKRFLAVSRMPQQTQIVVAAMDAPYYLDSTEISKLTAYYGVYGTGAPFVDAVARALFLGVPFSGDSPISVSGVNYNIVDATSPDAAQIIKLTTQSSGSTPDVTPATAAPVLVRGDTVTISTGTIFDRNGHAVPDGTPVEFIIDYVTQGIKTNLTATTASGTATASFILDRSGQIDINVQSPPALNSDTVQIIASAAGDATITVISPEITPTEIEPTADAGESAGAAGGTTATNDNSTTLLPRPRHVNLGDLVSGLLGLLVLGGTAIYLGYRRHDLNYGLIIGLATVIAGLIGYLYFALALPGAAMWEVTFGSAEAASSIAWIFGFLGGGGTYLGLELRKS